VAQKIIPERALAALLEQASRLSHSAGHSEGLYPAQWAALRFVADARGAPPTAARLARFQGMSLGPVSRTVRTLIEKGLMTRVGDDGRGETLALTRKGRLLLERDPAQHVARAIASLGATERECLAGALEAVIRSLLAAPALRSAGLDSEKEILSPDGRPGGRKSG
jgi:DNA-binding MarR family transcriptional regulator